MCKNARKNWLNQQFEETEHLMWSHRERELLKKKKSNFSGAVINYKEGKLRIDTETKHVRWIEYIGKLYEGNSGNGNLDDNECSEDEPPMLMSELGISL